MACNGIITLLRGRGMKFNDLPLNLVKEWDYTKNESKLDIRTYAKYWWLCSKEHSWNANLGNRISGCACPYCSGRKATTENCLSVTHPEIADSWHTSKNGGVSAHDVKRGTKLKYWWVCKKGHDWQESPKVRIAQNQNCPYCSGKRACKDNCLENLFPELVKEWDFVKNEILPSQLTSGSSKFVWWICNKKHSFKMQVNNRVGRGSKCPFCLDKLVCVDNCLETLFPDIAKEWHTTKNTTKTPKDFMYGSAKKAWWLCEKGHAYFATIASRTSKGSGCPNCLYKTEQNVRDIFEEIFKKEFPKKRPAWLITPRGTRLELDGYNEELRIAFEYDGEWHDKPHPRSLANTEFLKVAAHDNLKNDLCRTNSVFLIRIHYSENKNLKEVIIKKIINSSLDNFLDHKLEYVYS